MTITNRDIAIYLHQNYQPVKKWPLEMVQRWFEWFQHFELYEVLTDEYNNIKAIAFARPVKQADDGLEEYQFDPTGECIFADLMICEETKYKPQILQTIYRKYGNMKTIAFKRAKNLRSINEYDFNRFARFFQDKENK